MSTPLCPLCDARMRVLDGRMVCPSCGHSRPIRGHKIGLRAAILMGALLASACGARTEPLEATHEPPSADAPLPDPETAAAEFADTLCAYDGPALGPIVPPPGPDCISSVLHALASGPPLDVACLESYTRALEANAAELPNCSLRQGT